MLMNSQIDPSNEMLSGSLEAINFQSERIILLPFPDYQQSSVNLKSGSTVVLLIDLESLFLDVDKILTR